MDGLEWFAIIFNRKIMTWALIILIPVFAIVFPIIWLNYWHYNAGFFSQEEVYSIFDVDDSYSPYIDFFIYTDDNIAQPYETGDEEQAQYVIDNIDVNIVTLGWIDTTKDGQLQVYTDGLVFIAHSNHILESNELVELNYSFVVGFIGTYGLRNTNPYYEFQLLQEQPEILPYSDEFLKDLNDWMSDLRPDNSEILPLV